VGRGSADEVRAWAVGERAASEAAWARREIDTCPPPLSAK